MVMMSSIEISSKKKGNKGNNTIKFPHLTLKTQTTLYQTDLQSILVVVSILCLKVIMLLKKYKHMSDYAELHISLCPCLFEEYSLSPTPVRPVRLSVCPFVCPSFPTSHLASRS